MNRFSKGFTLVELLTVVAVLGVLAAVAFPNMRDYMDKQRLVSQIREISEMTQFARSEAIRHSFAAANRSVAMTVKPAAPWFVGLSSGVAACTTPAACQINQGASAETRFLSKIAIAAAAPAPAIPEGPCAACVMTSPAAQTVIVFDMRGLVTGAAEEVITLQSPMGKELSVSVSRLGRISLCTPAGATAVGGFPTC